MTVLTLVRPLTPDLDPEPPAAAALVPIVIHLTNGGHTSALAA
jgi:hypothetical protein